MLNIAEQVSAAIDDRLSTFTETFESKTRDIDKKMKKKFKYQQQEFSDKGNKSQYQFNSDLLDSLDDLEQLRAAGKSQKMKTKIKNMVEDVKYRNKLITIAEGSQAKWKAAERYDKMLIADDSDDEKKIRQADSWAVREMEKEAKKGRFTPYMKQRFQGPSSSSWASATSYEAANTPQVAVVPPIQPVGQLPIINPTQSVPFRPQSLLPIAPIAFQTQGFRQQAPRDICLLCGGRGHWRNQCPFRGQQQQ